VLHVLPFPPVDPTRIPARDRTRRPARTQTRRRLRLAAAVAAAALVGSGAPDALAASGPTTIAYTQVDRMVQSTGNLYWTSHYRDEFHPPTATVYRASKWTTPGQERALYTETGTGSFYFGDLTYAYAGDYYAYFVATIPRAGCRRSSASRSPAARP
jgi:hypothetical protein